MIGEALWAVALVFGVTILVAGAMRLVQVPFALAHAVKYRPLPADAPACAPCLCDGAGRRSVALGFG